MFVVCCSVFSVCVCCGLLFVLLVMCCSSVFVVVCSLFKLRCWLCVCCCWFRLLLLCVAVLRCSLLLIGFPFWGACCVLLVVDACSRLCVAVWCLLFVIDCSL